MNTEFFKVFPVLELSQECADWFSEGSCGEGCSIKIKAENLYIY